MNYKGFKIEKNLKLTKAGKEIVDGYFITFPSDKYPCEWAKTIKAAKTDIDFWAKSEIAA
jgi:hypothetical protein